MYQVFANILGRSDHHVMACSLCTQASVHPSAKWTTQGPVFSSSGPRSRPHATLI